ncbi:MAG TPA: YbaN family protein [Thermotogota bacterium]|nr:YbaN family protein [Thermotogota bacterium]
MKKERRHKGIILKTSLMIIGSTTLVLGLIGVFIPVLPTTPFLLISVGCYANSSEKMHAFLLKSKIYENTVEKFLKEGGMSLRAKLSITIPVGILLTVLFFLFENPVVKIIIAGLFVAKVITFIKIPTINKDSTG